MCSTPTVIWHIINYNMQLHMYVIRTDGELKDWTKRHLWSKTTLNTGGMGRARVNPPTCKMGNFFVMSLTLTEPSLNNFQLNGAKNF